MSLTDRRSIIACIVVAALSGAGADPAPSGPSIAEQAREAMRRAGAYWARRVASTSALTLSRFLLKQIRSRPRESLKAPFSVTPGL